MAGKGKGLKKSGERQIRRDCKITRAAIDRILAWRNATVDRYNAAIFHHLYPDAPTPFVAGQKAIAGESFEIDASKHLRLSTSEEVEILSLAHAEHLGIDAFMVTLKRSDGSVVTVPVPADRTSFRSLVETLFSSWRAAKKAVKNAATAKEASEAERAALALNKRAWVLKTGFADLRHPWAMTVHKAQGSTYDTVFIDWSDLQGINAADFPRIFYTAVTRPAKFLAICY